MLRTQRFKLFQRLRRTRSYLTLSLNILAGWGTIFESQVIYKHDDGKIVFEKTLRIEILFAEEPQIKALVAELKKIFNQESIAVQVEDINSDLW